MTGSWCSDPCTLTGRCRGPWSPIFNLMARKQSGNRSRKMQRRPTRRGPTELGMLNSRADAKGFPGPRKTDGVEVNLVRGKFPTKNDKFPKI